MNSQLEILGCGPSPGTPVIGCPCAVCTSTEPKNKRLRTSARIILDANSPSSHNILIDTSPDLRQQALRSAFSEIEAVLFTHAHADHILGLEELRGFFFKSQKAMPVYLSAETLTEIKKVFHYIFSPAPEYKGTLPLLDLHRFEAHDQFSVANTKIRTFTVEHGHLNVSAFRIGNLSYVTDVKAIPTAARTAITGSEVLVLGALGEKPHPSHLSINEAITIAEELGVKSLYLTHLGHTVDYNLKQNQLPSWVKLCYDGLMIPFDASAS